MRANRPATAGRNLPLMAFGGAIALGAAALGLVALAMPIRAGEFLLGPRLFPYIVMGGLVLLGLMVTLSGWRGAPSVIDAEANPPVDDWWGLAQTGAGLVLFCLLVEGAGFVIAATALFAAVAFAFGSRRIVDAAIGFALAAATFAVFKFGLGLNLPAGQWFRPILAVL